MATHMSLSRSQPRGSRLWLWIFLGAVLVWLVFGRGLGFVFGDGKGEPVPAVSGVTEVAVRDNRFAPEAIKAPAGTAVTWRWEGNVSHNVVGDGFESPVQRDGMFTRAFDEPGTYDYQCTLHGGMRGQVMVTEGSA